MDKRRSPQKSPRGRQAILCLFSELQVVVLAIVLGVQVALLIVTIDMRAKAVAIAPFPAWNAQRLDVVIAKMDSLDIRLRMVEEHISLVADAWEKHVNTQ